MTTSANADAYAAEKIQQLVDTYCHIPIRPSTPIAFYYKTSDTLIEEADHFYKNQEYERSFILYSRYATFFVETLKRSHPQYATASSYDRQRVKEIILSKVFPRAEELKKKLKEKYRAEYVENERLLQEEATRRALAASSLEKPPTIDYQRENQMRFEQSKVNYNNTAIIRAPVLDSPTDPSQITSPKPAFDRAQKPIYGQGGTMNSYRHIFIPNDITVKFLEIAQKNTARNIETCGILTGVRRGNDYVISHIVVPKQNGGPDSCDTEKEEEMLEFISAHSLITLGWIHTHPTQTAFLSSVDLHTHLPYQMLMQEAIAIVISPKYQETGIFSLTQDFGIPALSTCRKTGFHEHTNASSIYTRSQHISYDPGLSCEIIDLRN